MATIRSPGQILKVWKKSTADYFKANKLKEFPDKENVLNVKLVKGLERLRKLAGQGDRVDAGEFTDARDGTLTSMQQLRKLLLPTKSQPTVKKFFQTLSQLTVVVEQLEANNLDANEEDLPANALDGIDPDAVDAQPRETTKTSDPVPTTDGAAAFKARLKKVMPDVVKITQAKLKGSEMLTTLVTQANAQAGKNDFDLANIALDKAEKLLQAFAKSAPPPAPPGTTGQVAVLKRLSALTPDFKAALAKKGPEAGQLQTLFGAIKGPLDEKNFQQVAAILDKLEPLVARALAAQPIPDAPPPPSMAQAEVTKRLSALMGKVKTALAEKGPNTPRVQELLTSIKGLIGKKDFEPAGKALDELEALLGKGAEPEKKVETPPRPMGSRVQYARARLQWDQARKTVQAELKKLEESILAAAESDPNYDAIAAGTSGLYEMLEVLDTRLIDKLDEALNAEKPEVRQKLDKEAGVIVKEYQSFVNSDPLVQAIDDNPFSPVAVRSTLVDTLNTLATQLA